MPKTQSEIFEKVEEPVAESEVVESPQPPKKVTIKQKKEISAERLEQLKEQLARGRAAKVAKKELAESEKKKPIKEVAKSPVLDKRPVANQVWGEEIAELKNEIKSLKSRLEKPVAPKQEDVVVIKTPKDIPKNVKVEAPKQAPAPTPVSIPKNNTVAKPPPSAPISIPKPKPNIYSAFKVANW
jgi:hypothetical protein